MINSISSSNLGLFSCFHQKKSSFCKKAAYLIALVGGVIAASAVASTFTFTASLVIGGAVAVIGAIIISIISNKSSFQFVQLDQLHTHISFTYKAAENKNIDVVFNDLKEVGVIGVGDGVGEVDKMAEASTNFQENFKVKYQEILAKKGLKPEELCKEIEGAIRGEGKKAFGDLPLKASFAGIIQQNKKRYTWFYQEGDAPIFACKKNGTVEEQTNHANNVDIASGVCWFTEVEESSTILVMTDGFLCPSKDKEPEIEKRFVRDKSLMKYYLLNNFVQHYYETENTELLMDYCAKLFKERVDANKEDVYLLRDEMKEIQKYCADGDEDRFKELIDEYNKEFENILDEKQNDPSINRAIDELKGLISEALKGPKEQVFDKLKKDLFTYDHENSKFTESFISTYVDDCAGMLAVVPPLAD